ncbi:MAG: HAD family hydrolase [Planctomycetota bacterium]
MPQPAVFLDRDDTLIPCNAITPHGDLGDPDLVQLLPGARDACARLKDAGYALVVFTNQGGVARGRYPTTAVEACHERLNHLLGGLIDTFRYCPYHPSGTLPDFTREHPWRKPQPGMIRDAAQALDIDLARSWAIGDKPRDCQAAKNAGPITTILISDLWTSPDREGAGSSGRAATSERAATVRERDKGIDHLAPDIAAAAEIVLSHPSSS